MKVYSNLNTLQKVKTLFKQLGVSFLLDGGDVNLASISDILEQLLDQGKAVEFLRIITRDNDTDFAEMDSAEVGQIITDFFHASIQFFPEWMRSLAKSAMSADLSKKTSQTSSSITSTPSKG